MSTTMRGAAAQVVGALQRAGPVSRAELARRTGLSPSTVSMAVSQLMDAGRVVELPQRERSAARGGRPAVRIALHRSSGLVAGIEIGKRHVRVAVADLAHDMLAELCRQLPLERSAAADLHSADQLLQEALSDAGATRGDVVGVGMALPGPLVSATGTTGASTIMPGWVDVPAATAASEVLHLPVTVDNDANLGALGEATWGVLRNRDDAVYLHLSTGIGAGLVLGGRHHRGVGGTAGEIGHVTVDPSGPFCRCGNRGCLEALAGSEAILAALRPVRGDLTVEAVIDLARQGDGACRQVLSDAGRVIGRGVGALCNLLNPGRIAVGGELAAAGELLLTPLDRELRRTSLRSAVEDVEVVQGALGQRAEVLGALALAARTARLPLTGGGATGTGRLPQ